MNKTVYKTNDGRKVVESIYRKVLEGYSLVFEQFFINTESGRTHVLRFGEEKNPPLFMVHGSTSNSAAWFGNIPDFIDHFCVYCADIPGEPGLSHPIRQPLASQAPREWLRSLLDYFNIENASFVTMSLGSWYALNLAIEYPKRVSALSMITLPGIAPAKKSFIFKAILFMMLGKLGQRLLNKAIYHKTMVPPGITEFQSIVSKHFKPLIEEIPEFRDEQLIKISAPVQYFGGDHDALLDTLKTAERLKRCLPHSEINILKNTGHVIINQFPVIKDFLIAHILMAPK